MTSILFQLFFVYSDPSTGDLGIAALTISPEISVNKLRGAGEGVGDEKVTDCEDVRDDSSEEAGDMEMELGDDGNLIDDDQV